MTIGVSWCFRGLRRTPIFMGPQIFKIFRLTAKIWFHVATTFTQNESEATDSLYSCLLFLLFLSLSSLLCFPFGLRPTFSGSAFGRISFLRPPASLSYVKWSTYKWMGSLEWCFLAKGSSEHSQNFVGRSPIDRESIYMHFGPRFDLWGHLVRSVGPFKVVKLVLLLLPPSPFFLPPSPPSFGLRLRWGLGWLLESGLGVKSRLRLGDRLRVRVSTITIISVIRVSVRVRVRVSSYIHYIHTTHKPCTLG